ncbi:hypothetical protein L596_015329 [Steinernema carpocapsae]|uniref:Saposin B-type domain-containing protein n=1 Tax=Steinernema carpocapsae TaxID=34508 RepID=A0A4V6XW85_STECR|nr:hypothetical protein L596_015329 [Steinernema carpocapsae]
MKTFAVLALLAFVSLSSATAIRKELFEKKEFDFCKACVDVVTKAEATQVDTDKWLKEHIPEFCAHFEKVEELQKFCTGVLTKLSAFLDKAVKEQVLPQKACEEVKLC